MSKIVYRCSNCHVELPRGRKLRKCQPCHDEQVRQWRAGMTPSATAAFPGVDIDAIHYKTRATR